MKKRSPAVAPSAAATPGIVRALLTVAGLLLLAVATLANYTPAVIFADQFPAGPRGQSTIFIHLPGMAAGQYRFFPFWWFLAILPAVLIGLGLLSRRFRTALLAPWRSLKTALPLAGTLLFLVFTTLPWNYLTAKPHETGAALVLYTLLAGSGFTLLVAGLSRSLGFLDRLAVGFYDWMMALDRRAFMLLTAGFVFVVSNIISWLVFEHMPHIQDSISQLFQARIFAAGRLWVPSPRFPDFFDYTHIINNGHWYSQYPFLHSLILLPGVLVGAPWLINPLLGALTMPVIYLLGRELYDERTGRLAAALGCVTPFIFNLSAEYMNHSSALLFGALFTLYFFRVTGPTLAAADNPPVAGRQSPAAASLLAGLFLGLMANIRPYTAFAFAVPFAAFGLWQLRRRPGRLFGDFLLMAVVAGAITALVFVYNWLTNGDPMLFGYVVKWGPGHEVGFGKSGWGPQHTPMKGLVNMGNDFNLLSKFLYEWPLPSILPLAVLFAAGTRDRRDWLLLACFLALPAAYFFYWFHNVCFGPRFLYEASAALLLLTVRGFIALGPLLRRTFRTEVSDRAVATFAGRIVPLMLVFMLGVGLPPLFKLYHGYGGVDGLVQRTVRKLGLRNALVFCSHLGAGFSANALDLAPGNIVYAKDHGLLMNAALTVAWPDRNYYYANRDTVRMTPQIRFAQSRLRDVLLELATFLADSMTVADYKTIIWSFADLPPPLVDSAGRIPPIVDYRQISREIFAGRAVFSDYLPAVACWMLGDGREHLKIFTDMNDVQNFISDDFKFTLFHVTSQGDAAVYDIRPATGREVTVPDAASPVPIR